MKMFLVDEPEIHLSASPSAKFAVETDSKSDRESAVVRRELQRQQAINRMLVGAIYEGLRLRGLWTAINDPLALNMERDKLRTQFRQIELTMRAAIEKAEEK